MSPRTIRIYLDYISPNAYLAWNQLPKLAEKYGFQIEAVPVLYAALLDGNLRALILDSPPATQNAPSERDGRGPAIEMLNCLRITDLAQISGLLYPLEQVFLGQLPLTYAWAEEIYNRSGPPGKLLKLRDLNEWQPA